MSRVIPFPLIKGHTAYNRRASLGVRALVVSADVSLIVSAFCEISRYLNRPPVPRVSWLVMLAGGYLLYHLILKQVFKRTLGEFFLDLKPSPHSAGRWNSEMFQHEKVTFTGAITGIFLTGSSILLASWSTREYVWKHPLFMTIESVKLAPFFPQKQTELPDSGEEWSITPFYYLMGAWPKTYTHRPVFYSLPYRKGLPNRFIDHIVARWEMPDIQVTFEGPRTPSPAPPREEIKRCLFNQALTGLLTRVSCFRFREAALMRHIDEIHEVFPKPGALKWKIQWILVENPAIPPEEQAQGVFLSVQGPERSLDRAVLITARGTHQAITLQYPNGSQGEHAASTFDQAIRSLRISDDLAMGRAWVERTLENTRLSEIESTGDSTDLVRKLAETQALLISKITVDPKTFDTYFHLGGTAYMLLKLSLRNPSTPGSEDWSAVAKPMIQSVLRYAQDLSPQEKRIPQLQSFWIEAQK